MAKPKSSNITWHEGQVSPAQRSALLGQRGATLWLTGLSGSGKSTIAVAAEGALIERGHMAYVLDGDNVRHGLNKDLGFSPEDRTENIRRIGEVDSRRFLNPTAFGKLRCRWVGAVLCIHSEHREIGP